MVSSLDNLAFRLTIDEVVRMPAEKQNALKQRCQTDLRFLTNCILRPANKKKFPPLLEKVHGKIIDAFPKCDPNVDPLEWASQDEFVIMASRGMLKSTIGMAFLTQCMLCNPDMRILIMSGKIEKAQSILAGARKPFMTNEIIRFLFPEWSVDEEDTNAESFICPNRSPDLDVLRDPTLSIASFDSIKAGGHYEIVFLDDATNEINSSTLENCEKTHGTYDDTDELLEPGAMRVFLATKWHENDLPWYIKTHGDEEKEAIGAEAVSYFVLPAWTLRTDGTPREVAERIDREKTGLLQPEDVNLTWPEKLTARFLFKKYRKNRADFYKQYLLDASVEAPPKAFTDEILNRQFTSPNDLQCIPYHDRSVVVYWDLASAFTGRRKKSDTDYSCGIIAVFQNSTQKMWIAEVVLAHFNTGDDAANAIVQLYRKAVYFGKIVGHGMEDAAGARYLGSSIDRAVLLAWKPTDAPYLGIQWHLPDNSPNAKNVRIAILASAMKDGYVYINANVSFVSDLRRQFENWDMKAKRRKDDGPDCIAQVWQHYRSGIAPVQVPTLQPSNPTDLSWVPEAPKPMEEIQVESDEEQQRISAEFIDGYGNTET